MTSAKCLCEAVTMTAATLTKKIHACHCTQCQRWTGGGPLYVIPIKDLKINGIDHIGTYHASEHGERAFCKQCGTTLYWAMRNKAPEFLPIGLFEDQSGFAVKEEIFVDYRPNWMPIFAGANQSTEAEQLRLFEAYKNKNA